MLAAALRAMPADGVGPRVLGAHLEGPFLSPERLGVHAPRRGRRDPDLALLRRLLDAGPVSQMTLAPELPGALELVDELRRARRHRLGRAHRRRRRRRRTARSTAACARSRTSSTRCGRAPPRDPGIAFAALARPDVVVQLIVDGHHLAPDTVRVAWQAAAGRFALVTDAVAAAAMGDGEYRLGWRRCRAEDGMVRGAGGPARRQRADDDRGGAQPARARRRARGRARRRRDRARARRRAPRPRADRASARPADLVVLDDRLEVERVLVPGGTRVAR